MLGEKFENYLKPTFITFPLPEEFKKVTGKMLAINNRYCSEWVASFKVYVLQL